MLEYKIDGWTLKLCLPAKICVTSNSRREADETALFWATRCVVAQKSALLVQNVFSGMKRKFRLREEERKLRLKSEDYNVHHHCCKTFKSHRGSSFHRTYEGRGNLVMKGTEFYVNKTADSCICVIKKVVFVIDFSRRAWN